MAPTDACQYTFWVPALVHSRWRQLAVLDCHADRRSHSLRFALRMQPRQQGAPPCMQRPPAVSADGASASALLAEPAGPPSYACRTLRDGGSPGHVLARQPASAAKRTSLWWTMPSVWRVSVWMAGQSSGGQKKAAWLCDSQGQEKYRLTGQMRPQHNSVPCTYKRSCSTDLWLSAYKVVASSLTSSPPGHPSPCRLPRHMPSPLVCRHWDPATSQVYYMTLKLDGTSSAVAYPASHGQVRVHGATSVCEAPLAWMLLV